jgi:hypothetical protein
MSPGLDCPLAQPRHCRSARRPRPGAEAANDPCGPGEPRPVLLPGVHDAAAGDVPRRGERGASASSGSPAPPVLEVQALPVAQAAAPPAPLPRPRRGRQAGPADADSAASQDAAPMPVYSSVRRPQVSGGPPWGPAPKPPGPDLWAAGNLAPGWSRGPEEGYMSPGTVRPASSEPPPGTPAPGGNQANYPRHSRRRLSVPAERAEQPRQQRRPVTQRHR